MAICRFCQQEFVNSQAVRAHLKACAAYQNRSFRQISEPPSLGSTSLGNALRLGSETQDAAFDPVHQMQQRVAAERLRLKLRGIEQAHKELDAGEAAKRSQELESQVRQTEAARAADLEREALRIREESATRDRREAEEVKQQLNSKRRDIIQDVKHTVVDLWFGGWNASAELKAQILLAIEAALVPLPLQELPKAELVKIAEGVRERLYKKAIEAQNAAEALVQQKQALQRYGLDYAKRELKDTDGLEITERWRIEALVKAELQELTGHESRADVMAWVDDILDDEGLEFNSDE